MKSYLLQWVLVIGLAVIAIDQMQGAQPSKVFELWPAVAPGEKGDIGEERDTTKSTDGLVAGKRVIRLGNVSKPTLSIYPADRKNDTGTTVLVVPGGGYHILALDLEGTEVCEWLNSIGVTAALLKYRVPARTGLGKHEAPLQDAQRAMGLLRSRAKELGLNPQRLGAVGFSAGGHLIAALSSAPQRTYPQVDAADSASCSHGGYRLGRPGGVSLLKTSRLIWTYSLRFAGTSSSGKIAVTGHSGSQAPQSMHSSGWM